jgi:hypothetical protein
MTRLLSIDPGKNTGIALGEYGDDQPYRLLDRWQVHRGKDPFKRWLLAGNGSTADEIVCEKFILSSDNEFVANTDALVLEGILEGIQAAAAPRLLPATPIVWQPREKKGALIGYSPKAKRGTKANRQRERFDFLEKHGLFLEGTDNDDTNDAITHALVYLKTRHYETAKHYWPGRRGHQ